VKVNLLFVSQVSYIFVALVDTESMTGLLSSLNRKVPSKVPSEFPH